MFAIIAAILFGLALLLDLINEDLGDVVTPGTLVTAGFLCLALHFVSPGALARRSFRRRG